MLLVLFKVLPSLLLRILGLGRNPNKTLGFWEQTNNYAIVWKTIPSFKSPCSSIPLILACLISFLSLPLPLPLLSFSLLSLSIRFGLSKNERPIFSYLIFLYNTYIHIFCYHLVLSSYHICDPIISFLIYHIYFAYFLSLAYIVYLIYFILFLVSCSLQVSYAFMSRILSYNLSYTILYVYLRSYTFHIW